MDKKEEIAFYDLLGRQLSGDATHEDMDRLHALLASNPTLQLLYDQMQKPSRGKTIGDDQTDQAYAAHFVKKMYLKTTDAVGDTRASVATIKKSSKLYKWLVAASLAALIASGTWYLIASDKPLSRKNELVTQKGSKSNLTLSDGTKVILNADSRLVYDEAFFKTNRELTLVGEAYFDVAHDEAHPFVIHTGNADIKVLGTAFNVRNYPTDRHIETTLMRGKIEVSLKNRNGEKIVMKPMEKLLISKIEDVKADRPKVQPDLLDGRNPTLELTRAKYGPQDSSLQELAWIEGKMSFDDKTFLEISKDIERNFSVKIVFENPAIEKYKYTGTVDNQNLEDVLQLLRLSKNFNYAIKNQTVIIK